MKPTRRALLSGLAAAGLLAAGPAATASEPAVRVRAAWPGRDRVTVVATTFGDPRFPSVDDDEQAALLIIEALLHDDAHVVLAASGAPGAPRLGGVNLARALQIAVPERAFTVIDGGAAAHAAIAAHAEILRRLADPADALSRARRAALHAATTADRRDVDGYLAQRADAFAVEEAALQAMSSEAEGWVAALPAGAVVVTRALGAARLCHLLEHAGRGGRLTATDAADQALDGEELRWATLGASLPLPGGAGLRPWAVALRGLQVAFAAWPRRAAFTADVVGRLVDTPRVDGALAAHLAAADAWLTGRGFLGIPAGLPVHVDPGSTNIMGYDFMHGRLRVAPQAVALAVPTAAAVLRHELMHARDVAAAAAVIGVDPRGVALLAHRLPGGATFGLRCSMEDHAYGESLDALEALGVTLPPPGPPAPNASADAQILALMATLQSVRRDAPRWTALVEGIVSGG